MPAARAPNRPFSYSRYWTGTSLQVRLMRGSLFKCKLHSSLFNDIPPHEPPLQASSSPIPRIRKWPIPVLCQVPVRVLARVQALILVYVLSRQRCLECHFLLQGRKLSDFFRIPFPVICQSHISLVLSMAGLLYQILPLSVIVNYVKQRLCSKEFIEARIRNS